MDPLKLQETLLEIPEEELSPIFSSFKCEKNSDVEIFLKEKAVLFEQKHKSRTYLIVHDDSTRLLEYYSQNSFEYFQKDENFIHMIKFLSLEQF